MTRDPAETFPRFTAKLPNWVEQFRLELPDYVNLEFEEDSRGDFLRQLFGLGNVAVIELYADDPVPLAIALSRAVFIETEYLIPERRLWNLHSDEWDEMLDNHMLRGKKPMVARYNHELVSWFLIGFMRSTVGLRLYYEVALILDAVARQPDLKRYLK